MSGTGERWGGPDWGDWEMENFFIGRSKVLMIARSHTDRPISV